MDITEKFMNNIDRINGYGRLPSIGQPPGQGTESAKPISPTGQSEDQVEISQNAIWLSKIAMLPGTRSQKVQEIKDGLAQGTYDIDGKLSVALDNLLEEHNLE